MSFVEHSGLARIAFLQACAILDATGHRAWRATDIEAPTRGNTGWAQPREPEFQCLASLQRRGATALSMGRHGPTPLCVLCVDPTVEGLARSLDIVSVDHQRGNNDVNEHSWPRLTLSRALAYSRPKANSLRSDYSRISDSPSAHTRGLRALTNMYSSPAVWVARRDGRYQAIRH